MPVVESLGYNNNDDDDDSHGSRLDRICVRVIRVPSSLVDPTFTFSEFVAKNVAIRRARGEF